MLYVQIGDFQPVSRYIPTRVSAAADRPARRWDSEHDKYSASHHNGNQTIYSTPPSYWIQISTVGVINSCPTTIRNLWHSPANYVDSAWDDQTFQRYGCCPPKCKRFTWPNHAPYQRWFAIRGLALAAVDLPTKYKVLNSTHYDDMKGDTKCRNWSKLWCSKRGWVTLSANFRGKGRSSTNDC